MNCQPNDFKLFYLAIKMEFLPGWYLEDNVLLRAIDPVDVDAYMATTFPISMWPNFRYYDGHLRLFVELASASLPVAFNTHHEATFRQVNAAISLFSKVKDAFVSLNDQELLVVSPYLESGLHRLVPPGLLNFTRTIGSVLHVALFYVPLFADYYQATFPLFYPTRGYIFTKIDQMIRDEVTPFEEEFAPAIMIVAGISDNVSISAIPSIREPLYAHLTEAFGADHVQPAAQRVVDLFPLYRRMWEQAMRSLVESGDRLFELTERLDSPDLARVVEQYIQQTHPVYQQVVLQARREHQLVNEFLAPPLFDIVGQYLVPELNFP